MLSIHSIAAADAQGLASYYGDLAREDYYATGGEPPGQWFGRGAELFGLAGDVRKGELLSAMHGFHPREDRPLVPNAGDSRKPGWDCCFSAPKAVSAIWAVADRDIQVAIQRAQAEAVKAAVSYLEREAVFARRGHGGVEHERPDGIVAAAFEHSTSRNQDPQLHTHVLVMNLAPREDGTVAGIDLDTRHKMVAGAIYRVELASRLREHGFAIERDGSSFQIAGVPKSLTDFWSSRRAEVLSALQAKGLTSGRAAEIAALDTRMQKGEINRPELFTHWREQAAEFGFENEYVADIRAPEPTPAQAMKEPGQILREAMEQASTVSRLQLLHRVVMEAQGALSAVEAEGYLAQVTGHQDCVRLIGPKDEPRYTTREMIEIERRMADQAARLAQNVDHQIDRSVVSRVAESRTLAPEQLAAIEHIVSRSGAIACVQGHAGTGKSYMLDATREALEAQGYYVRGAALAGKAAQGFEESARIKSQTVHSLLAELESGQTALDARTVLVVDEAGMVGSRQMARIIDQVENAGAKLVLVGDSHQLQPIDAGGAFRAIKDRAGEVELTDIRRQHDERDRQVVRDFRDGEASKALESLRNRDRLHTEKTMREAEASAVKHYLGDVQAGKSSLLLAATRSETRRLNEMAREEAKKRGLVSEKSVVVQTERGEREFATGDRVVFLRNSRDLDVKNGTLGHVESAARNGRMCVQLDDGTRREFSTAFYSHVDHGYALTVHKAQGVTVDRAHVVAAEMTGREWSYVAASRAREETRLFTTRDLVQEHDLAKSPLARDMAREQRKDTTLEYQAAQEYSR